MILRSSFSKASRGNIQRRNVGHCALVHAWTRRHLLAGAQLLGVSDMGIWWNLPAPSRTTCLEPWRDVRGKLRAAGKRQTVRVR